MGGPTGSPDAVDQSCAVLPAGSSEEHGAIGAEGDGDYGIFVGHGISEGLRGSNVPQSGKAVVPPCEKHRTVGAAGEREHFMVAFHDPQKLVQVCSKTGNVPSEARPEVCRCKGNVIHAARKLGESAGNFSALAKAACAGDLGLYEFSFGHFLRLEGREAM